jgi:CheY-like chemotaxis protein
LKTILVVDDELSNAEVLGFILEEEGYRVFTAANGRHALERVAELRPDLVVLDFMMPVMDGAELGRRLRADPATSAIRILMNSSLEEDTVRDYFSGYDAFLRKPFNVDLALQTIARLLST